jgi:hypothetical protein
VIGMGECGWYGGSVGVMGRVWESVGGMGTVWECSWYGGSVAGKGGV